MTDEATRAAPTSLYKYGTIEDIMRILRGSIRFTQPSDFNDPFELLPEVVIPNDAIKSELSFSFDLQVQRRLQRPGALAEVPAGFQASDATSRDIVKQFNSLIGILCLSRVSDSLLMWAHYGAQYAGAVVEFDGSHEFFEGQIDVEYRALRPMRDVAAYVSPSEPIPIAELCVKSEQWRYEQEVRLVRSLADCDVNRGTDDRKFPIYTRRLPIECIKSVTLGERTPVEEQREVYSAVKGTHISLALAAIDNRGFSFRREPIKTSNPSLGPWITPRTARIFSNRNTPFGDLARTLIEKHPMSEIVNKAV
jgi:hypothetical protein